MNTKPIASARDTDLRLSPIAMQRAAQRARELAAQTGTDIIVSRNGIVERLVPTQVSTAEYAQERAVPYGDKG
jgi:hypothetical protein